jgi:hypothetical protein
MLLDILEERIYKSLNLNNTMKKEGKMAKKSAKKNKKEEKCDCKSKGGLFIPAGLFVGFGVGFLMNNLVPWMFIGLGAGFLGFALVALLCKCDCKVK